jgi:hypothetical protein
MAKATLASSDEQLEASAFPRRKRSKLFRIVVPEAFREDVKTGMAANQSPFVSRNGLAKIGEDPIDEDLVLRRHGKPCRLKGCAGRIGERPSVSWESLPIRKIRQGSKDTLVTALETGFPGDQVGELEPISAVLPGILQGLQRLSPQGVRTAIPEIPSIERDVPE